MLIVTGGAGFIGSNLVQELNSRGETEIVVVDDLTDGRKFQHLADCRIADYVDLHKFRHMIQANADLGPVEAVLHQGACSDTTEWNGRTMMDSNFDYTKDVFHWCQARRIPLTYASSAAVYRSSGPFREFGGGERPLNVYGWSKLLFDQWLARRWADLTAPVAGLRYFNVYGPREAHKGPMASVVHHFNRQLRETGAVRVFAGSHGFADGEHRRDFVYVGDVANVALWTLEGRSRSGIFNVGSGRSRSFNDVAEAVIAWHGAGEIRYVPMPESLRSAYQAFTEADLQALRTAGYDQPFTPVEEGVRATLDALSGRPRAEGA